MVTKNEKKNEKGGGYFLKFLWIYVYYFFEQNPDKINWYLLSGNPNAIHLLEQNWYKSKYIYI